MRIGLAIQLFFKVLFSGETAKRIEAALTESDTANVSEETVREIAPRPKEKPTAPARSDAITLLAVLQREARFVDLVKEQLDQYSDEQIGAAARDVLRDCGVVLDRLFAIQALSNEGEGADVETPAALDAGRFKLTGKVTGDPPFRGKLVHHGWQASRCELPVWSGTKESALVVSPIELEI